MYLTGCLHLKISFYNPVQEGIVQEKIAMIGITDVDAVQQNFSIAHDKGHPLDGLVLNLQNISFSQPTNMRAWLIRFV